MEATEKSVSRTDDDHPEDIDLVLSCPKCDFVTKSYAGLHIHVGQKHKTAATVKQKLKGKKKAHAPDPPVKAISTVMITLTVDEALDVGIALALVEMINADRFKGARIISAKVLREIVKQVPPADLEEAN